MGFSFSISPLRQPEQVGREEQAGRQEAAASLALSDRGERREAVAEEAVHWEERARPMHFYPVFSALLWRRLSGENVF